MQLTFKNCLYEANRILLKTLLQTLRFSSLCFMCDMSPWKERYTRDLMFIDSWNYGFVIPCRVQRHHAKIYGLRKESLNKRVT